MEIIHIEKNNYLISTPVNVGVVEIGNNNVVLIDSGLDPNAAKKILKLLEEKKYTVVAIINTHSHADHCGGNRYIKNKTNSKIFAPEIEEAIIRNPFLEPFYLFSGAQPPKELRNKFLMAQASDVDQIIKSNDDSIQISGANFGIVALPGHSPNQIGVAFENIIFCADSLFSMEVLEKHKIPFFTNISDTKETLSQLINSDYEYYIPSHAEPVKSIKDLANKNLKAVDKVAKDILEGLDKQSTTEQVLSAICNLYGIDIKGMQQYYLMQTVIMAYLSFLLDTNMIMVKITRNTIQWEKC